MLKSTHTPTAQGRPSLPPGWTEHKAPTGHTYYYNALTKKSTYQRPVETPPVPQVPVVARTNPALSFLQYQSVGNFGPNAGSSAFGPPSGHLDSRGGPDSHRGGRGGHGSQRDSRPKPQPVDKPKAKHAIPGCEPWFLIDTKLGRRFAYNSEKNQSFWRIPDKLKEGILALDQQRIKDKAAAWAGEKPAEATQAPGAQEMPGAQSRPKPDEPSESHPAADDSSEYEEVEVTDDEDEDNVSKRQRTEEPAPQGPVEFTEDDIAFQLAAMGQDYGLEPGEYDDGNMEGWEEGAEGMELTEEDATALFKDLLNDSGVSPYIPWDRIIEEGTLVDDARYTAVTTMRRRKEVWDEWSTEKIQQLRERRAREEKKDPRIPYLAFLQKNATPKLYWPEFRRKFKKEQEMRDTNLSDKDREKSYREHINRLKLPQATLKSDFLNLLKSQPPALLNNATLPSHLPPTVLADIKYISLDPSVRDPLVETFIATLPPPPEAAEAEEDEETQNERKDRDRRQKALEEREKKVAEEKRRQQKTLAFGKGRMREEEEEIARAMNVTRKGLKGHLMEMGVDEVDAPAPAP
ncbi:hypothetical protein V491_04599 [Pseudogymnoascus sp. VKM F-3775]|nr:hypothetical protein V491_04599 [Pseudogymnoascus sp. VKM F-3775]